MRRLSEVKKFFGFESYGQFQHFWQSLSPAHRLHFLSALGFTFATIGFVIDLSRFPAYRSFPAVLLTAASIGLMAMAMGYLGLKGIRFIPLSLVILIGGILLMSRFLQPDQEWILPAMQELLRRRR
jgi:hypothetical protein